MQKRRASWAFVLALVLLPSWAWGQAAAVRIDATRNDAATATGHSHTSAATITLTPTTGQFVYISGIDITNCEGAVTVTVAAPTFITTTNLTGGPQYMVGSGPGTSPGVCSPAPTLEFTSPVKATAVTTAVTFVLPTFIANQTISLNVYWYSAP
jgi:hypothetical protein